MMTPTLRLILMLSQKASKHLCSPRVISAHPQHRHVQAPPKSAWLAWWC